MNSTFKDSFENIFVKSVEKNVPNVQIEQGSPIELNYEYARLYNSELLNWGLVRVQREEEIGIMTDETMVKHKTWGEIKE